jgi:hypothetical protein
MVQERQPNIWMEEGNREIFPQARLTSTFYRIAIGKTLIQIN